MEANINEEIESWLSTQQDLYFTRSKGKDLEIFRHGNKIFTLIKIESNAKYRHLSGNLATVQSVKEACQ